MASNKIGRRLAFVGLTALVGSLMPLSAASAAHLTGVTNLDADNNIDAALEWSTVGAFPDGGLASGARDPQYVLIGRDDIFPDNLASGALQGADGPLLLTDTNELDQRVIDEIARLGVDQAIILGDEAAISAEVEADLNDLVSDVSRLGGATRIETAIEITDASGHSTAILARAFGGEDETQAFADSLAAGAWAAADDFGVLLTQTEVLTGNTADYLASGAIDEVIIVGGDAAVSDEVQAEVEAIEGLTVSRVAGGNRAATAVEIAAARGYDSAADAAGVILSEGYIADAWADGFPAAATSALEDYPVVLSNGEGLPPETEAFATPASNTNVVCGPYATAAACAEFAALTGSVDITLDATAVDADGEITGNISGAVDTVTVSGCGLADGTEVTLDEDGNFTIAAPAGGFVADDDGDAATEDTTCVLTFTITDTDGNEIVRTVTITINEPATPPGNPTVTDAPELVSAAIVGTDVNGTTIRFVFDEQIASATAGSFWANRFDATRVNGSSAAIDPNNTSSVLVLFPTLTTTGSTTNLSVATVDFNAAVDLQGNESPEGDAPLSVAGQTPATAGVTDAPDLVSVGNFRASGTAGTQTLVDFTFDETATNVTPGGYNLVPTTNDATNLAGTDVNCVFAGGNGTVTHTVACTGGSLSTTNVARGYVNTNTVVDSTGNDNPLQAADVSADGNTDTPSLVSASFAVNVTRGGATVDEVLYTFNEPVNVNTAGAFRVYLVNGNEVVSNGTATRSTTNANQVLVQFANGTLDGASLAVGASVDDCAVTESTGGLNRCNTEDEVAVAPIAASGQMAGRTEAPDLISVSRTVIETDPFTGDPVRARVIYTFDEVLDTTVALTLVQSELFRLYTTGGLRLDCQDATFGTASDSGNTTVRCTDYDTETGADASITQVNGAPLGTVDNGAVDDAAGNLNVEGAEVVS